MKLELINRTRSEILFRKITTWTEVKHRLGLDSSNDSNRPVTVSEYNKFIAAYQARESKAIKELPATKEHSNENNTAQKSSKHNIVTSKTATTIQEPLSQLQCDTTLFPFQERAAKAIYSACVTQGKCGYVMQADTGLGKTFIAGQFVSWLVREKWCVGKTWSPFPILWLTKASVVEQTIRVMENVFGFNAKSKRGSLESNGIIITNYDQLRSKAGKLYLKQEEFIQDGEYHRRYVWHQGMSPCVIIADECQALKNESTQSEILQAYSKLDTEQWPRFMLAMSATLWVTVSNAKTVICNMHMPLTNKQEQLRQLSQYE